MGFIWGPALVHVFITGRCVLGRSKYLSYTCDCVPYQGWLARWLLLAYVYTRLLERLVPAHLLVFFNKLLHILNIFMR